ncbi:hypothetical protein A7K50_02955 [Dehalobacter sp. MCB1]|nr:hypothetical protein A7K50_02955 [Dehalobacter sp. MCB1]
MVFNKVVDKATLFADGVSGAFVANTVAINTLDTIASGALTGKLSDDGLTLTVTATNALSKRYDVVVDLIKAKTGETITKYTQMYTFAADTTAPTIVSTTKVSSSVYKVIFSEPMKTLGTVTYTFADNTAAVVATDFAAGKSEVLFTIDAGVAVGKVITAQFIGAQDQNNNILATNPATTTFTKGALDGTKPTLVSITQTGAITFNVKFSEELAANPTVAIVGNATTKTEKDTSDATNYKITVTNPLEGATVVGVTAFTDLSGEAGDNTSRVISFVKDIASPKVTSTAVVADTADGKQYLEITFDRDVTVVGGSTVDAVGSYVKDYVTTNIDPAAVAVAYKNVDNKRLVRVALANLVAGADTKAAVYTVDLAFANLNSTAGIAADAVKAVSFTRGEDGVGASTAKVAVVAGTVKQGVDNNKVEVVFDKAVDGASATAVNNYSVAGAVVQSVTLLAVGADTPAGTVTAATEQAVVLNLQAGSNLFTGLRNITITNVKALGSSVAIDAYTGTVNIKENVVPTITSAKLTALNKVTLTFSEKVDTLAVDTDFELYIGGSKLAANDLVSTAAGDDVTTVVLTLEADVTAANIASGLTLKAISGTINIVDTAGNKISVPSTGVTVTQ